MYGNSNHRFGSYRENIFVRYGVIERKRRQVRVTKGLKIVIKEVYG